MKTRFFDLGGTCFCTSQTIAWALLLLCLTSANVLAQTGNDNPDGPAGIFNGDITTAGDYDPYTTNVRRTVADIVVAGSVGTQPLALVRTSNSRNPNSNSYSFGWGGWRHNYEWGVADGSSQSPDFQPASYTVNFPDGRSETFPQAAQTPWPASSKGVVERFVPMNPTKQHEILPASQRWQQGGIHRHRIQLSSELRRPSHAAVHLVPL